MVDASGNVVHRLLFNALRRAYEPVMEALAVVMQAEVSNIDGHAAVLVALEAGDPEAAARAVHAVVDHGAQATVELIDELLDPAPVHERDPR